MGYCFCGLVSSITARLGLLHSPTFIACHPQLPCLLARLETCGGGYGNYGGGGGYSGNRGGEVGDTEVVKLKAFSKFENTSKAMSAASLLIDSKPSKGLHKFFRSHCEDDILAVADSKLGNAIEEKLQIECVHNNVVMELMRGVRSQLTELISGLASQDLAPMSFGLSHSLSIYRLKFSPDKYTMWVLYWMGYSLILAVIEALPSNLS